MIRKLAMLLLLTGTLFAAGYGGLVWHNNREVDAPSSQDIAASWEKSVSWLMNNREKILRDKNAALWWMIGQSAQLTGDSRLQGLFGEIRRDFAANYSRSAWRAYFSPSAFWGAIFQRPAMSAWSITSSIFSSV